MTGFIHFFRRKNKNKKNRAEAERSLISVQDNTHCWLMQKRPKPTQHHQLRYVALRRRETVGKLADESNLIYKEHPSSSRGQ